MEIKLTNAINGVLYQFDVKLSHLNNSGAWFDVNPEDIIPLCKYGFDNNCYQIYLDTVIHTYRFNILDDVPTWKQVEQEVLQIHEKWGVSRVGLRFWKPTSYSTFKTIKNPHILFHGILNELQYSMSMEEYKKGISMEEYDALFEFWLKTDFEDYTITDIREAMTDRLRTYRQSRLDLE